MVETTRIKNVGNSLGIIFDKGILEKIYHLKVGDAVEIDYRFSEVYIRPLPEVPKETRSGLGAPGQAVLE